MQGTVDGFSYGLVTPLVAYLMACLGGALGLRCTTRSLRVTRSWRPGWLALGSAAIGSGIWTMHFIAMMGFTIEHTPVRYDWLMTFASLAVAIVMVGVGIFIVGYRGRGAPPCSPGHHHRPGHRVDALSGHGGHAPGRAADVQHLHRGPVRRHSHGRRDRRAVGGRAGQGFLWSVGASLVMGLAVTACTTPAWPPWRSTSTARPTRGPAVPRRTAGPHADRPPRLPAARRRRGDVRPADGHREARRCPRRAEAGRPRPRRSVAHGAPPGAPARAPHAPHPRAPAVRAPQNR